MALYAYVSGGIVLQVIDTGSQTLAEMFAPGFAAQCVAVPAGVSPVDGWTCNGSTFAAPAAPPAPTLAQQAAAAVTAGMQLISTGTPALNGTYAIDPAAQMKIMATSQYISVNGKFYGGATNYPWLDTSGTAHTFPSVTEFQAFASAVAGYVAALDMIIAMNSGALPTQPVSIA